MSNTNWDNDSIQFPRLIAEIEATNAFELLQPDGRRVIETVADSMDLDPSDVYEIVERAAIKWDQIKARTSAPAQAGE